MHERSTHERSSNEDVLSRLRVRDTCYCQSLLKAPWGISMPEESELAYYIFVARGKCVAYMDGKWTPLETGDFLFWPHGTAHAIADTSQTPLVPIDELAWESVLNLCIVKAGGSGEETHLMTGSMEFEAHPLLPALPQQIRLKATHTETTPWLKPTVDAMIQEAANPRLGTEVVLSRFAEVLAVGAIRHWIERGKHDEAGLLRGLSDRSIRTALDLIHKHPERRWTLATLAKAAGKSRTDFSARFNELLGVSPIKYWTHWRLCLAAQWLRDNQVTIDQAAERLGYSSRAAFSRAFKSVLNVSPGAVQNPNFKLPMRTMNERMNPTLLKQ